MARPQTWPAPTIDEPADQNEYLADTMFGSEQSEATDGCTVEPDGTCPHGYPSWELYWGLI